MAKKVKVRIVCKDGIVRTFRMLWKNFIRKVRKQELIKVSYNKKLKRWVWRKPEIEKVEKIEKKIKRRKKPKRLYKVHIKLDYINKNKPYKNLFIDGFVYVKATNKEEAKLLAQSIIASYFNEELTELDEFRLKANLVRNKEEKEEVLNNEKEGIILYKNKKERAWKQMEVRNYV